MKKQLTIEEKCAKGSHDISGQPIRKLLWQEGEDGTQYKWNKVGSVKAFEANCKHCGFNQEFMGI